MPKLYHRGEWYLEIAPNALAESEFEDLLVQNAEIILPGAFIVPFKKTIYSTQSSARADLALIARDFRQWAVIEVEMLRHSLYGHVLPQVRTLREGSYDIEHARYLASRSEELSLASVSTMLRGDPPKVLVLVDKADDEWRREIARYGGHLMVFQVYRAESNRHIFAIDGAMPRVGSDVLTELRYGFLPRCLTVASPAALGFDSGVKVAVMIDDQLTFWERFDTATGVYLTPVGQMPIRPRCDYVLLKSDAGQYEMRPATRAERMP